MNYENIEPMVPQLMAQLLHLQNQLANTVIPNIDPKDLVGALGDFINQLGTEMNRQAT
jgi:hypothetical protein